MNSMCNIYAIKNRLKKEQMNDPMPQLETILLQGGENPTLAKTIKEIH